jgi:hypothetical protein
MLGLSSGLLALGFTTNISHAFLIGPTHGARSAHLILFDLIILISGEKYKLWSSSLCNFLQIPDALHLCSQSSYRVHQHQQSVIIHCLQQNQPVFL